VSTDARPSFFGLAVNADPGWMMQLGEKWAFEGLLSQVQPGLAVEVGTYEGGSLRRIAAHAGEVHAFDIDPRAQAHADRLANVTLHLGDSAQTLPQVLADLAAAGRHVDFALVDGLHTHDAVTADAWALLDSPACTRTVIVFHDSAHAEVRAALEDLDLREHPKVGLCLLDFVPGYLVRSTPDLGEDIRGRAFNGLALVVLDPERDAHASGHDEFVSLPELHRTYAASGRTGVLGRLRRGG
jgi:methyltransferase family protein